MDDNISPQKKSGTKSKGLNNDDNPKSNDSNGDEGDNPKSNDSNGDEDDNPKSNDSNGDEDDNPKSNDSNGDEDDNPKNDSEIELMGTGSSNDKGDSSVPIKQYKVITFDEIAICENLDCPQGCTDRVNETGLLLHKGLNVFGICSNTECKLHKKRICSPQGYGKFDYAKVVDTAKCPNCKQELNLEETERIVFCYCEFKIKAKKKKKKIYSYSGKTEGKSKTIEYTLGLFENDTYKWSSIEVKELEA